MRFIASLIAFFVLLQAAIARGDVIIDDFSVGDPFDYQYSGSSAQTQVDLNETNVLGGARALFLPSMHGNPGMASVAFNPEAGRLGFSMQSGSAGGGRLTLRYGHPETLSLASHEDDYLRITFDQLDAGLTKDGSARRDSLQLIVNLRSLDPLTEVTHFTNGYLTAFNAEAQQQIYLPVSSLTSGSANPANANRLEVIVDYLIADVSFEISDIRIVDLDVNLPGDFNNDGVVDTADYTVWRNEIGSLAQNLANDVNGGVVGSPQYETWKARYGEVAPENTTIIVPEPNSVWLLLSTLAFVLRATPRTARDRFSQSAAV